jgi:glycine oxidase
MGTVTISNRFETVTVTISMTPPIVIIGAGVIGCAIARELAARGLTPTVLDDRPPGGGATQASAGMLAPHVEGHDRGPLLELGVRSLDLYDDWIATLSRESGIDIEYRRLGTLEVALDAPHADELRRMAERRPPPSVIQTWMSADEAKRAHPALGSITGALFTPVHGYVSAPELTHALSLAATRYGATFRRTHVQRIFPDRSQLSVVTNDGELAASVVVLAAGAWTNQIATEPAATPPLRPVRGQLLHLGWQGHPLETIIWGPECYIVPRVDGSLLVGATVEDVGFDERTTCAGVRDLLDAACELLPQGWGATFLGARVGLRPATPDELPVLGPDPRVHGLVHASGHFRNGVLLAPLTALVIADWIQKEQNDPALDALRPGRFGPP